MEAFEGLAERQITAQAQEALIALQKCLQVSGQHAQLVEAQVARFNLWATNIGVFAKYKASLDFRLRDSPDVQRIIINLLDILGVYAGQAIRIESVNFGQDEVTSAGTLSAAGRQTETFSGDAQQAFQIRPLKDLSIIPAYQAMDDTISRLHRLSTAIRNAGVRNPYSRIARLTIVDEDGNDINDLFESFIERVLEVRFPCLSTRLRRRVGDAICFRRRRFTYNRPSGQRNGHQFAPLAFPDEPKASHLLAPSEIQERPSITGALGQIVPQALTSRTASTFHPHRFQNPRPSEPSVASTATAPSYVPRIDESIPKAPSVESPQKEAQCPFCPFVVSIKDLNGIRWIKHFLNDLEPYVCLFEDCMSPHQLFSSVEQWLDHLKSHPVPSTNWICSMRHSTPTETVMKSAEEFTGHMRDAHPGRFTDTQIKSLEARAARPGPMFPSCLLCDWSVPPGAESEGRISGSLTSMEKHIADHLVDLALLSLPPKQGTESDDEVSMNTSGNVSLNSGNQVSHSALSQDLSGFGLHNDQESLPDEERTGGMNQKENFTVSSSPSVDREFRPPHHPDEGHATANVPLQERGRRDRRSLPSQLAVAELPILPEPVPAQSPDSSTPLPPPSDYLPQTSDQLPLQWSISTCSWENCPYTSETGSLNDLLKHIERDHISPSGHVCYVCGISFGQRRALSEHMAINHAIYLEPLSGLRKNELAGRELPFFCKWIGCPRNRQFLSSVDLLEHITAVHIRPRDLVGSRSDFDGTTNSQIIPDTTPLVVRQDSNGVQWIAFEYSRDRVKMEYTIRCDVESVNVDNLSQEFKTENCIYPRAHCSKDQYRGNRWISETEFNAIGWALAELNPTLRGKRGLIHRAAESWRNSNRDPRLRSRRVRRMAEINDRARGPSSPEPETRALKDEPPSGSRPTSTRLAFEQTQDFQEASSDPIQSAGTRSTPLLSDPGDVSSTKRPFIDISPAHDGSKASIPFTSHAQEPSASVAQEHNRARRAFIYGSAVDHDQTSFDDKEDDDNLLDAPPPPLPRRRGLVRRRGSLPPVISNGIFGDEGYYRMPPPPSRHRAAPNIIPKRSVADRKSVTAPSVFAYPRSPPPAAAAAAQQQQPEVMTETDADVIQCICQFSHDDGSTILCDQCGSWQHIECYYDGLDVPESHMCGDCRPRSLDVGRAKDLQARHLEQVQLASQRKDEGASRARKRAKRDREAAASTS